MDNFKFPTSIYFTNYTCCVITYCVGENGPLNCINITTLEEGTVEC